MIDRNATIIDLDSRRRYQVQAYKENILHLRLLTDCLADIAEELHELITRLESDTRNPVAGIGRETADLAEQLNTIARRLVETLECTAGKVAPIAP